MSKPIVDNLYRSKKTGDKYVVIELKKENVIMQSQTTPPQQYAHPLDLFDDHFTLL